jgi:hypothetical protein
MIFATTTIASLVVIVTTINTVIVMYVIGISSFVNDNHVITEITPLSSRRKTP